MKDRVGRWREWLRIAAAITAKDLLEALKNKNTVMVLITVGLMAVFYRYYPGLVLGRELLNVLIYDEGRSSLVASLEQSQALDAYTGYRSAAHMLRILSHGEVPELGLVIPAGFDAAAEEGTAALDGYVLHWVSREDTARLRQTVEAEIVRLTGRPVAIRTEGNVVYPDPESSGLSVQAGFSIFFVVVVVMVGLILVAHLMLEEKQARTIDALRVSPASAGMVALGKALAGLFYCLLGAGVALALNHDLLLHWWLAVLAVVTGSAFTVAVGLWLGNKADDRGQLMLWSWIVLIPLLLPMFMSMLAPLLPQALIEVMRAVPTVVAFNLIRTSLADPIDAGRALLQAGYVFAWAAAVLVTVAWQVRQMDREEAALPGRLAAGAAQRLWSGLRRLAPQAPARPAGRPQTARPAGRAQAATPTVGHAVQATTAPAGQALSTAVALYPARPVPGILIAAAIAAKDIREAIGNRIFQGILLGVGLMFATGALLPRLLRKDALPVAFVYDEGQSALASSLAGGQGYVLRAVESRAAMEAAVAEAPAVRLGLVIPAGAAGRALAGEAVELQGYWVHWADREAVARLAATFEDKLSLAGGTAVRIDTGTGGPGAGHRLYPRAEAGGQPGRTAILMLVVIATLGTSLVPLLLVEEKQAHTLEALLASPARLGQVVSGKALAGTSYCLAASAVLLLLNTRWIVSWGTALAVVVLGTGFAVAVGLLVGALSDDPTTTGMWGAIALLGLTILTALAFLGPAGWPAWLRTALLWTPGALAADLFRLSMAGEVPLGRLAASAAALAAEAGAVYLLLGWRLRRLDR